MTDAPDITVSELRTAISRILDAVQDRFGVVAARPDISGPETVTAMGEEQQSARFASQVWGSGSSYMRPAGLLRWLRIILERRAGRDRWHAVVRPR